jgi:hypothetical protein
MAEVSDKDRALAQELMARWKDEWSLEAMADPKHAGWRKLVDESLENHIATAIAASRTAEWQDIGTAPRDGTKVLFYTPECPDTGWLAFIAESFYDHRGELNDTHVAQWQDGMEPTHWMPLPDPPESK